MEYITKYPIYENIFNSWLTQAKLSESIGETLNAKERKTNYKLQKLIIDDQVATDENDNVNGLNNYFCSIGHK